MKTQSKDLSKRERDVVEFLLQGKSNKQIALALGIAESTVEFHLKNIYAKLQVRSRAEAILKLGKSVGPAAEHPGKTTVEKNNKFSHTGGNTFILKKEIEMKNRLFSYFFPGMIFGVLFWFYLEIIEKFMNRLRINEEYPLEVWAFISLEFLLIFGV